MMRKMVMIDMSLFEQLDGLFLRSCPFCSHTEHLTIVTLGKNDVRVFCAKCKVLGPKSTELLQALDTWNTRPVESSLVKVLKVILGGKNTSKVTRPWTPEEAETIAQCALAQYCAETVLHDSVRGSSGGVDDD